MTAEGGGAEPGQQPDGGGAGLQHELRQPATVRAIKPTTSIIHRFVKRIGEPSIDENFLLRAFIGDKIP
jgi:hypothetical protein